MYIYCKIKLLDIVGRGWGLLCGLYGDPEMPQVVKDLDLLSMWSEVRFLNYGKNLVGR